MDPNDQPIEPLEIEEIPDEDKEKEPVKKMSNYLTYFSLLKGYCGLMVLVVPHSYARGGWLFSPISMTISGLV